MVVKLVRLSAMLLEKERGRESSHQEGTVGGEVPSLVLKVCIKGEGRRRSTPHGARFVAHAWVFSFEEEVNERTNEGGSLDHYKSSRMTSHAIAAMLA